MSMRRFSTTVRRPRAVRALVAAASLALLGPALVACDSGSVADTVTPDGDEETTPAVAPLRIRTNVARTDVPITREVRLTASGGTLRAVRVTSPEGPLAGELSKDQKTWVSSGRLEPGVAYRIHSTGMRSDGKKVVKNQQFRTHDLTLDEQTYPSVAPLEGETVGVGMPVIVTFDIPVTNKASIEKHMSVTSSPRQPGSWHWMSDQEVHWRPRHYWQAGTDVAVDVDINSIPAGGGIFGQESRHVDFNVGDAHVYKVNMDTHQMRVFSNGGLLRTIPITTGEEPKFTTRSGVKVILEKFRTKRMNSETIGIDRNSPDGYDIDDVEYAMRVTYSGEFVHAAPWSVGDQGSANVSHGCTGMSTANAGWLYNMSRRGDVVEYTGTDRPMELTNGYGDWNLDFADWSSGSALS
ncbi:MAG: Ig-like domain-containing protein [Nocardioides sp.]|jgi:lipoprotein-anchoring transpeptidase ErfK/SrfK